MAENQTIRIGCAAAFWGDTETAAAQLVEHGDIDYLVFDYLAEITMAILAGARARNARQGFAVDFITVLEPLLDEIASRGIRVVCNAGGVNPMACREALQKAADKQGVELRIAVVLGDDLLPMAAALREQQALEDVDTGRTLPRKLLSLNAYLGARPIARALGAGADVVITGRCVDSAVALGPLMHEFDWRPDDYDRLAAGSLAGHLIECGTQCTGGNFTDWDTVQGYDNMGFPVIECRRDGSFVVTKPADTGGLVTPHTVAEQLLYEIGDPRAYVLPDVTCDFTRVRLEQEGPDRVLVSGTRGRPPTPGYKVSATWQDGFRCTGLFMLGGTQARAKAEAVSASLLAKVRRTFASRGFTDFAATSVEILGTEATYGAHARTRDCREVVVKITAHHQRKEALALFAREIAQASTAMAPGITGLVGGRPKVSPLIRLQSALVPKELVQVQVVTDEEQFVVECGGESEDAVMPPQKRGALPEEAQLPATVPLLALALARSGDKGNHCNIGVIARERDYLPYLRAALTSEAVAQFLSHVFDGPNARVQVWELRGIGAINVLLLDSLGGGGTASLRMDAQGKAYAQQLLEMPVPVPAELAAALTAA